MIIKLIAQPLGFLMRSLYGLVGNYSLTILLFTLLTKIILLPVSLLVQKNSIKMVKMRPELDALRFRFVDDKDRLLDEQIALYKREKYHPLIGIVPLLIQIPLILGVINVVYNPLTHLLGLDGSVTDALVKMASDISGAPLTRASQLKTLLCVQSPVFETYVRVSAERMPALADAIRSVRMLDMHLFGMNLAEVPSLKTPGTLLFIPLAASLSSLLLSYVQNRANVLQSEENKFSKWALALFLFFFSLYFSFVMPGTAGYYWTAGNLFSIPLLFLVNLLMDPRKHIDYQYMETMKRLSSEQDEKIRTNRSRSRRDYRRFIDRKNSEGMQVVFYSESSGFYKYFRNIIESILDKSTIVIHYITNDPDDIVFSLREPRLIPYYISENQMIPLMMKIRADIVVMTVPDLEKYHIKRSRVRDDVEYIYVDHGGTSLNLTYRTGAFDHYDTMFVVNQRQEDECRAIEKLRNTKRKRIVRCGYGQIDNMMKAYSSVSKEERSEKTILIAPSWQEDNILDSCVDDLLAELSETDYRVIIRPHPQYIRRFPVQTDSLIRRTEERYPGRFIIQTDFSSNSTIYEADLVITDWSAIGVEFSLTTLKPTLFMNTPMKVVNPDWQKIDVQPFIIDVRSRLGMDLDPSRIKDELLPVIRRLISHPEIYRQKILDCRDEFLFHPGHSGEVGADYIINRIEKIRGTSVRTKPPYVRIVHDRLSEQEPSV